MTLDQMIEAGDAEAITKFATDNNLIVKDGCLVPRDDTSQARCAELSAYWDQMQQCRKILLNIVYGALLNEGMRLSDQRMGQSVTLTGRRITRHMGSKINEIITGENDYQGGAICYGDTDSIYFSMSYLLDQEQNRDRDFIIDTYDKVAEATNQSFPDFMHDTFNTSKERGSIIAAKRELVASKVLFIKKKKYACLIYDMEGVRLDKGNSPGKLKAMGLDLKRSDTPDYMQNFLERILMDILQDSTEKDIVKQVAVFREEFRKKSSWDMGSPKKVNNLSKYNVMKQQAEKAVLFDKKGERDKKGMIPGHVLASINWNNMLDIYKDKFSMRITDGSRIVVCKLKPNYTGMTAIAYPKDELHLPQWFRDLPFDQSLMEEVVVDKKIDNLIGVLKWNLAATKQSEADDFIVF